MCTWAAITHVHDSCAIFKLPYPETYLSCVCTGHVHTAVSVLGPVHTFVLSVRVMLACAKQQATAHDAKKKLWRSDAVPIPPSFSVRHSVSTNDEGMGRKEDQKRNSARQEKD